MEIHLSNQEKILVLHAIRNALLTEKYTHIKYRDPFETFPCWKVLPGDMFLMRLSTSSSTEITVRNDGAISYQNQETIFAFFCGLTFNPFGKKARIFREIRNIVRSKAGAPREKEIEALLESTDILSPLDELREFDEKLRAKTLPTR